MVESERYKVADELCSLWVPAGISGQEEIVQAFGNCRPPHMVLGRRVGIFVTVKSRSRSALSIATIVGFGKEASFCRWAHLDQLADLPVGICTDAVQVAS